MNALGSEEFDELDGMDEYEQSEAFQSLKHLPEFNSEQYHVNKERLADIAEYIGKGEDLLKKIQFTSESSLPQRRYRGADLAAIVGVTPQAIYAAQREGKIPMPDTDPESGKRLGTTHEQAMEMKRHFGTLPTRAPGELAVTVCVSNFKGGCWKTTTAWYAASYYAQLGYKVLAIDLDPQGSLTQNCGIIPDAETSFEDSLAPYIIDTGETDDEGHPLNDLSTIHRLVRDTQIANLKIIPSTLSMSSVELYLPIELSNAAAAGSDEDRLDVFHRVKTCVNEFKEEYDIIIIDGTPSLGMLPMNILFASDTVIVPVPTESNDFASTITFCNLYFEHAETFVKNFGGRLKIPQTLYMPTRYSSSSQNVTKGSAFILEMIRSTFGKDCLRSVVRRHDAVVSNLTLLRRTAFQVSAKDAGINNASLRKAIDNYSEAFDEILERAILPYWPSMAKDIV